MFKKSSRKTIGLAVVAILVFGGAATATAKPISIIFITHSSPSNQFWQTVKNGFNDACGRMNADCQMLFTQKEGSIQQELSNLQTAIARKPTAILTTIPNDHALNAAIKRARSQGIIVLAVNVDASEGTAKNAQAFIGQSFKPAGYRLGKAMAKHFPKSGPINVLVGISAPGQSWSEQRGAGIISFLKHYQKTHPDRTLNYKKIDSGTSLAKAANQVGAYLTSHPKVNVYFDTGYWDAAVARDLRDQGKKPGQVRIGGFDLVPIVLKQMQKGYVQVQIDQQPYMQGFVPVVEVYLIHKAGLSAFDVHTGKGLVTPENVDKVIKLAQKHLR